MNLSYLKRGTIGQWVTAELMSTYHASHGADNAKRRLTSLLTPKHCIKQITYLEETYLGKTEAIIKRRAEELKLSDNPEGKQLTHWGTAKKKSYVLCKTFFHLCLSMKSYQHSLGSSNERKRQKLKVVALKWVKFKCIITTWNASNINVGLSAINFKKGISVSSWVTATTFVPQRHRRDSSALLHRNIKILCSSVMHLKSIARKGERGNTQFLEVNSHFFLKRSSSNYTQQRNSGTSLSL